MITPTSRRSFDGLNAHLLASPSSKLLATKHAVKVRHLTYRPGRDRFFGDSLNLYRPTGLEPKPGDWLAIEELLQHLFPDSFEREHVLDVLAFHVQNPGVKIKHVLLVRGPQGAGKNTLAVNILEPLCGPSNVRVLGADALTSSFNMDLLNTQVLVLDEVMLRDGWAPMNQFKPFVTQELMAGNAKFQARADALTPRLILVLSNDKAPIPVEEHDRRYFVPAYGQERREPRFYSQLYAALREELPGFLSDLLRRDVSRFDPNAEPPMTRAKSELQAAVRPPLERQFLEWLEEGRGSFARDVVLPNAVMAEARLAGYGQANEGSVIKALRAVGGEPIGQLPSAKGDWPGRPRCWAVRNHDHWQAAGGAACGRYLRAPLAQLNAANSLPAQRDTATVTTYSYPNPPYSNIEAE